MTSSSPMAFLTEPPAGAQTSSIADPQSMKRVHDSYGKVHDVINQIGNKVSGVLAKQENEFLGAYRAHMYNVQKELQALRAELVEKENALANNEQMKKLEEECEWYRRESLRLDSILTQSKKHERFMKEKMQMLEDDRNWMAGQLKLAKKQNKLLRAEIELQLREGTDANENMFAENSGVDTNNSQFLNRSESLPQVGRPGSSGNNKTMGTRSKSSFLGGGGSNQSNKTTMKSKTVNHHAADKNDSQVTQMLKTLKLLKHQNTLEKKANNNLRAQMISTQSSKREFEEFFVDCIADVKKQILRRRQRAARNGGTITEVQEQLLAKPIELHDFMACDRVRVVEELLARDDVLSFLYDRIFPDSGGGGGGNISTHNVGGTGGGRDDLKDLLNVSQETLEQGFPVPS